MTNEEFRALLTDWSQAVDSLSEDFTEIRSLTDFLEPILYDKYEPARVGAQGTFAVRLAAWIGSARSDIDKRALYLLLGRLVYLGREQDDGGLPHCL